MEAIGSPRVQDALRMRVMLVTPSGMATSFPELKGCKGQK
jgi:hypothetical protein